MRMARIARAARILVTMALLWLLWSRLDGPAALRQLAGADPGWLGGALLALTAQTILSAWRWRLTARGLGQSIPPGRALSEYYLAQILNQTLPGGMLGDAGRAVRARAEAGLRRAAEAVVLERLAGQAGLLALMLAGILLAVLLPGGPALPAPVLATAGALFLIAISLAAAIGLRQSIGRALVGRHVLPAQITLSLGTAAANLLAFDFCARATGTVLGPVATLALVPLVLFTMVGNTVRTLQGVGWFPIHPIGLDIPLWMGTWLGIHPSVETLLAQVLALVFVIGSYWAAGWYSKRQMRIQREKYEAEQIAGSRVGCAEPRNTSREEPLGQAVKGTDRRAKEPI